MKCRTCGGNVEWTGNMEGPFQTKCDNCGAIDNQVIEDEKTPKEQKMSDIVERLRNCQKRQKYYWMEDVLEAAETIDKLRAENDELKISNDEYVFMKNQRNLCKKDNLKFISELSELKKAGEWVKGEPEKSGVYFAMSDHPDRKFPEGWTEAIYTFDADAGEGHCKWQDGNIGFYDNAITHYFEITLPSAPK